MKPPIYLFMPEFQIWFYYRGNAKITQAQNSKSFHFLSVSSLSPWLPRKQHTCLPQHAVQEDLNSDHNEDNAAQDSGSVRELFSGPLSRKKSPHADNKGHHCNQHTAHKGHQPTVFGNGKAHGQCIDGRSNALHSPASPTADVSSAPALFRMPSRSIFPPMNHSKIRETQGIQAENTVK